MVMRRTRVKLLEICLKKIWKMETRSESLILFGPSFARRDAASLSPRPFLEKLRQLGLRNHQAVVLTP